LRARQWHVRWVNRGGGCLLQVPGQLAIYPILGLKHLGLDLHGYLQRLQNILAGVLSQIGLVAERDGEVPGLRVGRRLIASLAWPCRIG